MGEKQRRYIKQCRLCSDYLGKNPQIYLNFNKFLRL